MSRIRSIKPEWLDDELLAVASSDARALSIALLCLADDFGNGRAGRVWLAGRTFPGKPLDTLDGALVELERIRYVRIYEHEGQRYFSVRNWDKHQRVDRPGLPKVPRPNPVTIENDTASLPATNSQEFPAASQESVGEIPTSRGPSPLPASLVLTQPPDPDPTSKPGSLRARGTRRDPKPFVMHDEFSIPEEFFVVQAEKFAAQLERVRGLLPEFRYFWKSRGDRKTQANWERTFANRVAAEARTGSLYAEPRSQVGIVRLGGGATPRNSSASLLERARRLEAEADRIAMTGGEQ